MNVKKNKENIFSVHIILFAFNKWPFCKTNKKKYYSVIVILLKNIMQNNMVYTRADFFLYQSVDSCSLHSQGSIHLLKQNRFYFMQHYKPG